MMTIWTVVGGPNGRGRLNRRTAGRIGVPIGIIGVAQMESGVGAAESGDIRLGLSRILSDLVEPAGTGPHCGALLAWLPDLSLC